MEKAWELLGGLNPEDVSRNASVRYDTNNSAYLLRSLGMDFSVAPLIKEIKGLSPEAESFIKKYGYFFNLSALWYLIGAKDVPPSGRHIKPQGLKGGHHFFMGTHELPLGSLASKYKKDKEGFLKKGIGLGGKTLGYGDASVELLPMPRVPVTVILWLADEEFPERADFLFDSTVEVHIPLDIIWSVAMMSVLSLI